MDVKAEVELMEERLRERGIPVADVLRDAGIAASSWQRWKTTGQVPLTSTWERTKDAYQRLVRRR
jgi:hypothetical protein